ncbi:hypothetical protein DXG03_005742 [Asterophora parasitica]|uniref:Uncharacterized protein n=1 Tax=Asterophora parasitica TaxID=117018 RepID=A0A9P7G9T9_9AGAR|nr:hypothetical protein DXG03_005742 [Asterophora parasitica]
MLLRFTAADMLNTSLIDVSTGDCAYEITTTLLPTTPSEKQVDIDVISSEDTSPKEQRHTCISDASGNALVSIAWNGRQPDINILDEKVGALTDLFGSSTVRFMPKILAVPTRFDTEYVWTATPDSLILFDYDSETTKGTFYQNVIRVPTSLKPTRKRSSSSSSTTSPSPFSSSSHSPTSLPLLSLPSSPSTASLFSSAPSSTSSSSPAPSLCTPSPPPHTETPKSSFIPTHLPGVGSNYLEFCQHPLAHDVELIVSFLMMEILRRGRFLLTPYTFEKPKMWQLKEARDLILRRVRRYTV